MSIAFQASLFDNPAAEPVIGDFTGIHRVTLSETAWVDHLPGWIANSDAVFESLVEAVPWHADQREMYDRIVDVPRLVRHYREGQPLPDATVSTARDALNDHYRPDPGESFVTAGFCFYRTGADSVAWHGDRIARDRMEPTMIAIVSFGAPRQLSLRPKGGGDTLRFPLGHGDLLVMGGSCQRTHEHAILKTARQVGPRISVQFRPSYARPVVAFARDGARAGASGY